MSWIGDKTLFAKKLPHCLSQVHELEKAKNSKKSTNTTKHQRDSSAEDSDTAVAVENLVFQDLIDTDPNSGLSSVTTLDTEYLSKITNTAINISEKISFSDIKGVNKLLKDKRLSKIPGGPYKHQTSSQLLNRLKATAQKKRGKLVVKMSTAEEDLTSLAENDQTPVQPNVTEAEGVIDEISENINPTGSDDASGIQDDDDNLTAPKINRENRPGPSSAGTTDDQPPLLNRGSPMKEKREEGFQSTIQKIIKENLKSAGPSSTPDTIDPMQTLMDLITQQSELIVDTLSEYTQERESLVKDYRSALNTISVLSKKEKRQEGKIQQLQLQLEEQKSLISGLIQTIGVLTESITSLNTTAADLAAQVNTMKSTPHPLSSDAELPKKQRPSISASSAKRTIKPISYQKHEPAELSSYKTFSAIRNAFQYSCIQMAEKEKRQNMAFYDKVFSDVSPLLTYDFYEYLYTLQNPTNVRKILEGICPERVKINTALIETVTSDFESGNVRVSTLKNLDTLLRKLGVVEELQKEEEDEEAPAVRKYKGAGTVSGVIIEPKGVIGSKKDGSKKPGSAKFLPPSRQDLSESGSEKSSVSEESVGEEEVSQEEESDEENQPLPKIADVKIRAITGAEKSIDFGFMSVKATPPTSGKSAHSASKGNAILEKMKKELQSKSRRNK